MPRSGSGTYTLPSGNPVVTGTTIESNWANTTLSDIATTLTDSLSRSGQGGMTAALRIADGTQGAPGLGFANETGSGFYRAGTAEVWAVVQGAQTLNLDASGVYVPADKTTTVDGAFVFNEAGADKDARFEGDTDANLLFTDASTDRVGVGTATPAAKLDVNGTAAISGNVTLSGGTANGVLYLNGSKVATSGSALVFDGTNLGIGTASPGYKLDVVGNGNFSGVNPTIYIQPTTNTNNALLRCVNAGGTGYIGLDSVGAGLTASYALNLFHSGAYPINFSTSATLRMTLDSSGNLGIGTSSPQKKLHVYDSAAVVGGATIILQGATGGYGAGVSFQSFLGGTSTLAEMARITADGEAAWNTTVANQDAGLRFYTALDGTVAEKMRLDASGNLLLGTTSTGADGLGVSNLLNLTFPEGSGTSYVNLFRQTSSAATILANGYKRSATSNGFASSVGTSWAKSAISLNSGVITFYTDTAATVANGTDVTPTERARITSGGDLLVGTSSGQVSATIVAYRSAAATACVGPWNAATSGDNLFVVFNTEATATLRGSIDYNRAGGLTRYNTTSDYRAKDILGPVQNTGATIDALKVYEGKMKGATQSRPMLIAHEAQAVTPYAVSGVKDEVNEDGSPKFQQMDVSSLVPLLLAEIQSLRARVAALEAA